MKKFKLPYNPFVARHRKELKRLEIKQKIIQAVFLAKQGKDIDFILTQLKI